MNTQKYIQEALDLLVEVRTEDSAGLSSITFAQGMKLAKVEGLLEFLNDSMKVAPSNNESIIL